MLGPLHAFSLLLLSTDQIDPELGCKFRLTLYFALYVLFANSALFNIVFRMVLIRFPQRGLVNQGQPNLRLFNQLFWVILVPYCCIGIVMFPINSIIRGTFPNGFRAKICLSQPVFEENIVAQNIVPMISQFLWSIFSWYSTYKINRHLNGICPDKKMSCIGKYRRNFTTFEQTNGYIKINYYYLLLHQGLIFSVIQATFTVTPETNFLISNICDFIYINVYHGIFLPMKMGIPPKRSRLRHFSDFFVRKPQFLEARCPVRSRHYLERKSKQESMEAKIKRKVNVGACHKARFSLLTKTPLGQIDVCHSPIETEANPDKIELCQIDQDGTEDFSMPKKSRKSDEISPVQTPITILVTPWRGKERKP